MKKIAVLTSGGDAPGMNAAIRAVVRVTDAHNISVVAITHDYEALIDGDIAGMDRRAVGHIIQRGGSILYS